MQPPAATRRRPRSGRCRVLTGCRAKKTSGADIHVGPSIDQVAAQHIGHLTRFPSLELTCDTERPSGNCDSGYACAYQYNVSWRSATSPMAAEANPRRVFERMFGGGSAKRAEEYALRQKTNRSILDFVREDARSFDGTLGFARLTEAGRVPKQPA